MEKRLRENLKQLNLRPFRNLNIRDDPEPRAVVERETTFERGVTFECGVAVAQRAALQHAVRSYLTNCMKMHGAATWTDAIFATASRMNHSCDPNVTVADWSAPEGFSLDVMAVRRIVPGEEISVAYVRTSLPKAKRQQVQIPRPTGCTP